MTCPASARSLQDHINIPITFATRERVGIGGMTEAELDAAFAEWQRRPHRRQLTSNWAAAGGFARSRPAVAEPDLQLYGVIPPASRLCVLSPFGPGVALHATLQRPASLGALRLRSADPLKTPAIDLRYFVSDHSGRDIATLIEGVRVNRRIAAQSPLEGDLDRRAAPSGEAESDDEIAYYIRGHCTTLYHPLSTCRMGADAIAVVDPSSMKVHGLEGLRIADASVIPRMISGNLQTPTIMLAERAARMILVDSGIRARTSMATGWNFHELYLWHDTGNAATFFPPGLRSNRTTRREPATKRRFRNLFEVSGLLDRLTLIRSQPLKDEDLALFHTRAYIARSNFSAPIAAAMPATSPPSVRAATRSRCSPRAKPRPSSTPSCGGRSRTATLSSGRLDTMRSATRAWGSACSGTCRSPS